MAYVKKIIGKEEDLIGIARLHWIYVVKGLSWFLVFGAAGWALDAALSRIVLYFASASNSTFLPAALMTISNGAMMFLLGGGFLIFLLFVIKVLVTEIALTSRRVIHKEGLLFIKVKQIDLEEIRGENLDLGWFGRILGYGYLMLDCRFIGDVRLPAIESPERFLKALHMARSKSQDSLSVVLGKGNAQPVSDVQVNMNQQQPELPQPSPPMPTPEIQPGGPAQQPEVTPPQPAPEYPGQPVPHGPPPTIPSPTPQQPQPEVTPQPQQPVPAPPPSQPPLQPPTSTQQPVQAVAPAMVAAQEIPQLAQQQPAPVAQAPAEPQTIDPKVLAQVVQQVMPQMAQQVAQELVNKGMIDKPHSDNDVDTDLVTSFDEAALDKDDSHDHKHKMEHAIH